MTTAFSTRRVQAVFLAVMLFFACALGWLNWLSFAKTAAALKRLTLCALDPTLFG